jgi:hypothetical protein
MMKIKQIPEPANNNVNPDDLKDTCIVDPKSVTLEDIKTMLQFINSICNATLDNGGLDLKMIEWLWNPLQHPPNVSDPDLLLTLQIFIAMTNAAQDTYTDILHAISQ